MTNNNNSQTDEAQIQTVIENWANATRNDETDNILAHHADNALIYDVLPPLKYEGSAAYKKSWADWQPEFEIPSLFNLQELKIMTDDKVAFCHCLIQCGGTLKTGEKIEDWVRATFGLVKLSGNWVIQHQHISAPLILEDDEA